MRADVRHPVLVVDDDPSILQTIQWILEDEGLLVSLARDGAEGLDRARERRPGLVVLDIALPRLNGYGFAAGLQKMYGKQVPILAVTADGRAREKAQRVGAYAYMQKPFDVDELVREVRRGLDRP